MAKRLGFMFAGQGAQFVGMGQDIAGNSAAARALFEQGDAALGRGLSQMCFTGPMESLTETRNCQPAIYTMSLACLEAFREQMPGVEPVACGGLSLGEFSALTAAGALGFEAGLKLVARRGELMGEACRASDGAMAAVISAEPALVERICAENDIDVANYNCPGQIVISGSRPGVEAAVTALQDAGVSRVILLNVDGAFHSRLMAPAAEAFAAVLEDVTIGTPACPVAQNVAGGLVTCPEAIKKNVELQVTGSVRWEGCVRAMIEAGAEALIEFGPGKVLSGFMRRIDRKFPTFNIAGSDDLEKVIAQVS